MVKSKAHREDKSLMQQVLDSCNYGIVSIDLQFKILTINSQMISYLKDKKRKKTISRGADLREFLPDHLLHSTEDCINNAFVGKKSEIERATSTDHDSFFQICFSPLKNEQEKIIGCTIAWKDLSNIQYFKTNIHEVESKYKDVIDSMPAATTIVDLKGNLIFASKQAEQLLGYSNDEIMSMKVKEFVAKEDLPDLKKYNLELLKGNHRESTVYKMKRKNGSFIYAEGNGSIIRDEFDQPKAIVNFFRDVTKKVAEEQKHQQNEATLEAIFNSSTDNIVAFDTKKSVITSNMKAKRTFKKLFKTNLKKGLDVTQVLESEEANYIIEQIDKVLSGDCKKITIDEYKQEGIIFKIEMVALLNKENITSGFLLTCRDITNSKNLENMLREREALLNAILASSPHGIYAIDKDYKFLAINHESKKEWKKHTGVTVKEGMGLNDFVDKKTLKKWRTNYFDPVFEGKKLDIYGEFKIEGENLYSHNHYAPVLDEKGEILGCVEFSQDVTGMKQNELTIQYQLDLIQEKKEELETYIESNLQLENFAYIASHDLKAPLRSLGSFAYLLKKKSYEILDDKSKNYIDIVLESANRMQVLIDDLLTYSRINTEKANYKKTNLKRLIDIVNKQLVVDIKKSNAKVIVGKMPDSIICDEMKLSQVFMNLIGNSIKFCPPERTPVVDISCTENKREYLFEVKDNGIGLAKKNYTNIFDLFKKLHSKDKYLGTGIGLTIVKKIVDQHDGKIWVESEVGVGTSFFFTICKDLETK